jgi:aspartyl-tRNA(Asn)/glutamyl-tRNA(Gln) amidotransferase subunit B
LEYESVIGLEVHVQLRTRSKMFCGCAADYQIADTNTRVCPVCMAMPGVLPVVNKRAVEYTIAAGLALNCSISELTNFDRKNYGYPDLMKGYQISQMDLPIALGGYMDLLDTERVPGGHRVGITRIHLEEDVARLTHVGTGAGGYSLMDINRAGVPLMECVSEPDIRTSAQAEAYILELQSTMRYLGISTANMEEGSFRCDANVSIRPKGATELGRRVEVKNMNRVRAVVRAIDHEIERQIEMAEKGEFLPQETRGWDDEKGITNSQRSKEDANDYRYFPEPDLPPIYLERAWIEEIKAGLPELANSRRSRFTDEYRLSPYDVDLLTAMRATADYFEDVVKTRDYSGEKLQAFAKEIANWVGSEMARLVNADGNPDAVITDSKVAPAQFADLVELFQSRTINNNAAKQVLAEMFASGRDAGEIVDEKGLRKVDDAGALDPVIDKVIADNGAAIDDYLSGKETAAKFLVGQVMKATRGTADANVALELIQEKIASLAKS